MTSNFSPPIKRLFVRAMFGDVSALDELLALDTPQYATASEAAIALKQALLELGQCQLVNPLPYYRRLLATTPHATHLDILITLGKYFYDHADTIPLLLDVIGHFPKVHPRIQADALDWLVQIDQEAAVYALERILNTCSNEELVRTAVGYLGKSTSPKAVMVLLNYLEKLEIPPRNYYGYEWECMRAIVSLWKQDSDSFDTKRWAYVLVRWIDFESHFVVHLLNQFNTPEAHNILQWWNEKRNHSKTNKSVSIFR